MEPGKRRGHQFSFYLLPSSLLLVYFTPVLFYTYPWTKDIGMNQTAIPLVRKRTSKQTVAKLNAMIKASLACCDGCVC